MNREFLKDEKGISLTEVLITTALLSIIMGSLYTLLGHGQNVFRIGGEQIEVQSNARVAFLKMSKEVRQSAQLVDTASYPSPPTNSYTLSVRGLQVVREVLTKQLSASPQTATAAYSPWLQSGPVIYKNGAILASAKYSINYSTGTITNLDTVAWTASDVIEASYTRDVYVQYYLSDTDKALKRKLVKDDGMNPAATLEDKVVTKHVVNKSQSPPVPLFQRDAAGKPKLVKMTIVIDKDINTKPAPYRLETETQLRN